MVTYNSTFVECLCPHGMNAVFDTQSLKMTHSGTKADKVRRFYVFYTTDKFKIQKKGGMGGPKS